jgi:hypothetical protein
MIGRRLIGSLAIAFLATLATIIADLKEVHGENVVADRMTRS